MLWLLLGGLALAFLLLSANRIASVDPRFLAQGVRWGGVAALAAASLVLLRSGRWALFLMPSLQRMMRRAFARAASPSHRSTSGPSQDTVVETATVRMRLNHASGTLDGDVLSGPHRGRRLGELEVAVVIALRDVCRRDDPDAAPLLDAYLDRRDPDWRDAPPHDGRGTGEAGERSGRMSRREALEVLGLAEGANDDAIHAAHHRLMKRLHPDQGGTTFLASQVNQAKDVLLGG